MSSSSKTIKKPAAKPASKKPAAKKPAATKKAAKADEPGRPVAVADFLQSIDTEAYVPPAVYPSSSLVRTQAIFVDGAGLVHDTHESAVVSNTRALAKEKIADFIKNTAGFRAHADWIEDVVSALIGEKDVEHIKILQKIFSSVVSLHDNEMSLSPTHVAIKS